MSTKKPLEKRVWTLALVTCALLVTVAVVRKRSAAPRSDAGIAGG